jgi:hypothetical protein
LGGRGRRIESLGQPVLYSKFQVSMDYIIRPCLRKAKQKGKRFREHRRTERGRTSRRHTHIQDFLFRALKLSSKKKLFMFINV